MGGLELTSDEMAAALADMANANIWLLTEFSDRPPFHERHHGLIRASRVVAFGVIAFTALWGFKVAIIDFETGLLHFRQIVP